MGRILVVLGALGVLAGCRTAPVRTAAERAVPVAVTAEPVALEASVAWRGGPVSGSLQTPRGGQPGSSSPGRPTLDEIGVTWGNELAGEAVLRWRRHEVYLGSSILWLSGDATLTQGLTTQGDLYPAGTDVDSSTWISFHQLAYRYALPVRTRGGETFWFRPEVGASGFHLAYALDGSNGESADRSYTQLAPHLGLGVAWRPTGSRVRLEAVARQTLTGLMPASKQVDLLDVMGRVHVDLTRHVGGNLGVGWRHLGFEDDQAMPNDIDVDFGPWFSVGVDVRL